MKIELRMEKVSAKKSRKGNFWNEYFGNNVQKKNNFTAFEK